MAQRRKYTLILKAPNRPDERIETDDQTEVLNWLAEFRMNHADPRAELYTRGEPGLEWWGKEDYHYQPFDKLDGTKPERVLRRCPPQNSVAQESRRY
jgi:hypothetical protein